MKKLFLLALVMILALGLAACFDESGSDKASLPNTTMDPNIDVVALCERLAGHWNVMYASENGFVGFVLQDDRPCVYFGVFDGGHSGYADLLRGKRTNEGDIELTIFFPQKRYDATDLYPTRNETLLLDLTYLERDGKINVKRNDRDWLAYVYSGATIEEARAKAFESH